MINVSTQKRIVIPEIRKILLAKGFIHKNEGEDLFLRDDGNRVLRFSFYFSSSGLSGNSLYSIAFKLIEDIIFEAGVANNSLDQEENKYYILSTICDQESKYSFTDRPTKIGSAQNKLRIRIEKEDDLQEWIKAFVHYVSREGKEFISRYSEISDLNDSINYLRMQGEKSFSKLLFGGVDHLFRALAISRLCNDSHYMQMRRSFDSIILSEKHQKWHSHYEKLKEILDRTKPL